MEKQKIKIGLALGGGSALGLAHIGVLKVLEENGIIPDYVAGTSMGSIIGALYCSGLKYEDFLNIANEFKFKNIANLKPLSIIKNGLYSNEKLMKFFSQYISCDNIENLKIPFCCNAVDLFTGNEYVFKSGNLFEAIRASSAIPGIFQPIEKDNMKLVDGGIVNNIPYDLVKNMGADYVIAIDVLPNYKNKKIIKNVTNIITYSFNIMQNKHEMLRLKYNKKLVNFVLPIVSTNHGNDYSQDAILSAIGLGEKVANANIALLKKSINEFKKKQTILGKFKEKVKNVKNAIMDDEENN